MSTALKELIEMNVKWTGSNELEEEIREIWHKWYNKIDETDITFNKKLLAYLKDNKLEHLITRITSEQRYIFQEQQKYNFQQASERYDFWDQPQSSHQSISQLDLLIINTTPSTPAFFNLLLLIQEFPLCVSSKSYPFFHNPPLKGVSSLFEAISIADEEFTPDELKVKVIDMFIEIRHCYDEDIDQVLADLQNNKLSHFDEYYVDVLGRVMRKASKERDPSKEHCYDIDFYIYYPARQGYAIFHKSTANRTKDYKYRVENGIKIISILCDLSADSPDEYEFWNLDRLITNNLLQPSNKVRKIQHQDMNEDIKS
jgi:hypothetical protein